MSTTRARRWRRRLLAGVVPVLLLLAAHPIWFPWVLRPFLRHHGVTFDDFRRVGYGGLQLTGVRWKSAGIRAELRAVRIDGPLSWIGRRARLSRGAPLIEINGWRIDGTAREPGVPDEPTGLHSTSDVLNWVGAHSPGFARWLERCVLREGVLDLFGAAGAVRVSEAEWREGRLTATLRLPRVERTIRLETVPPGLQPGILKLEIGSQAVSLEVAIHRKDGRWGLSGSGIAWSNRVPVEARFSEEGWLPEEARFGATNLVIPAPILGMNGYESVRGSFGCEWSGGRFTLVVAGGAEPSSEVPVRLPSVDFQLRADGNPDALRVEMLRLQAPWFQTELSRPVTIRRAAPWIVEPMAMRVSADLDRVPGSPLLGRLSGQLEATASGGATPRVRFALNGAEVRWGEIAARTMELGGVVEWPRLIMERCELELESGGLIDLSGNANLESRVVELGQWTVRGGILQPWLPAGWELPELQASGFLRGALTNLSHGGRLEAKGLVIPGSARLDGVVGWESEALKFRKFQMSVSAGESRIEGEGHGEIRWRRPGELHATVDVMRWTSGGRLIERLVAPFAIRFVAGSALSGSAGWGLSAGPAEFRGPGRELTLAADLEWPVRGCLALGGRAIELGGLREFLSEEQPEIQLEHGRLRAAWDSGAMDYGGEVSGSWAPRGVSRIGLLARFQGSGSGVRIESFQVQAGGKQVGEAKGDIPVVVEPGLSGLSVRWNETTSFDLKLGFGAEESLRALAERRLGWTVVDPQVQVEVKGTRNDSRVHVEGSIRRLAQTQPDAATPLALDDLEFRAESDRRRLRLLSSAFSVEGQKARLEGELPLPSTFSGWSDAKLWPMLAAGRARVILKEAAIDPFKRYLPRFLASQGHVDAEVEWREGEMTGEVAIEGAATVPLGPLASIREIDATVVFEGRSARLERCEGRLGGQVLRLSGGGGLKPGGGVQLDLALRGTNLPLVRRRGLLLRSDVDLNLHQTNGEPANITGEVRVHDSLLVEDLSLLVPGPAAPPNERPPYFAVKAAPYSKWRLGVQVRGDPALRVYSPIFQGTVGSNLRLEGTLGEPELSGELRANSGRVLFPFGNLSVDHAAVILGHIDPGTPHVEVRASALNYGYRIQMDVNGSTRDPAVVFSSTPPLSSQEILLLLTAGSVPQGRASYSTQDKVGRFGLILGRDFLARLGFSDSTSERLEFRTGEYVSEEGRPTQQVEYRLTERWSAYGEYDRFGGINGGLKWRILSR